MPTGTQVLLIARVYTACIRGCICGEGIVLV